jgi:hypothetical protein
MQEGRRSVEEEFSFLARSISFRIAFNASFVRYRGGLRRAESPVFIGSRSR